jgi:hypothetical protein
MREWVFLVGLGLCLLILGRSLSTLAQEPTPPGPYEQGQCGELAPEPSPAFAVPTNLTVSWGPLPDNPQFSGALLAWRDNADNEACYVVERRGPGATDWEQIMYAPFADREDAEDVNFIAPGYYCYRVFAGSEAGRSAYSNETCLQVPEATVVTAPPPGAPAAAFPSLGGGSPGGNAPSYPLAESLLAAGGILACLALLALALRRR